MTNYTERGAASQDDYKRCPLLHSITLSIDGLPKLDTDYVPMSESANHALLFYQSSNTDLPR
jgi:hypothetical protein